MTTDIPTTATIASIAQEVLEQRHIPRATYRLQFNSSFTFRDARALVHYLHDLGISDVYASPLLTPRQGSSHGYDICDHSNLNPDLGDQEDFEALVETLREHGMGLILDMVPNHMGIGDERNTWWMDVLENGPSSIYADYFDIDWHPVKPELENKLLLPILGDQYGNILESGQLQLSYEDGAFWLHYYEHKLPVSPRTYSSILGHNFDHLSETLGEDHENVLELASIMTAISYLPPRTELDPEKIVERNREKEVIKRRIANLYQASPEVQESLDTAVQTFNGQVGEPHSFDLLDALIDEQSYRLAFWRVATEEINYRRFFDINDLAAIRVEDKEVFRATHELTFELLARGQARGLRIDHPDGLWDPPAYFRQLQIGFLTHRLLTVLGPDVEREMIEYEVAGWFNSQIKQHGVTAASLPLYVIAEKILSEGEHIPEEWAVHGTTGYDFLNTINGIFVNSDNRAAFDKLYNQFLGREINYANLVNSTKKMIMLVSLVSQINEISYQLERIAEKNRKYRDFTLNGLTFAIREVIACLPVYRTYTTGNYAITKQDRQYVRAAVREAKRRNPRTAQAVFDFIQDTLLLRNISTFREEDRENILNFVMEVQQLTGPVMAKGLEDTAFYVYNRLSSLNEVGGHPNHFGMAPSEFHQANQACQQRLPHSMLSTSTHDTKRSEDVRARISVLSEMPDEWKAALNRWARMNSARKTDVNGMMAPERNDEYLLYQAIVGAWHEEQPGSPEFAQFRDRIAAYMEKATREAKVHTSWVNSNEEYDAAMRNFVQRVLDDKGRNAFLKDMLTFQRRVAFYGEFNALSQVLLKLTAPGMPDTYQGTELWDFSLVDPDNRRPVDYQLRIWLLTNLKRRINQVGHSLVPLTRELLDNSFDGRIKMYIIYRTLNFRRAYEQLFAVGTYVPLEASGAQHHHVCAFARQLAGQRNQPDQEMVVVVPRLIVGLTGGNKVESPPLGARVWKDTWLQLPHASAGQTYQNLLTGELLETSERDGAVGLAMVDVCAHFPVALLVKGKLPDE